MSTAHHILASWQLTGQLDAGMIAEDSMTQVKSLELAIIQDIRRLGQTLVATSVLASNMTILSLCLHSNAQVMARIIWHDDIYTTPERSLGFA
jgi:hypothetical protein